MSIWGSIYAGIGMATDAWSSQGEAEVNSPACHVCGSFFSLTIRRHRCRACLENVCGSCSQDTVDLDGDTVRHRVCTVCFIKLDDGGLIGQIQSRSKNAPQKSKFKLTLLKLRYGSSEQKRSTSKPSGQHTQKESIVCDFIVGDKRITSLRLTPENMSLSFEFIADIYSPIESFVLVTASDRAGGLELAHCRIVLPTSYTVGVPIESIHNFISKDRSFPIDMSIRMEMMHKQPRELEKRPALRLEIPMLHGCDSGPISFTPGDVLYLEDLFPPSSKLFGKLFHCARRSSDSETGYLIPSVETIVEVIDDCWIHSSATSMVSGVLMLTSHRLLFLEYGSRPGWDAAQLKHLPLYLDRLHQSSNVFFIPIASTAEIKIRRLIQKYYHGLEVVCKDGISCVFRFRREAHNDMTLLEKFRRIKVEMLWRREEDSFAFSYELKKNRNMSPVTNSPGALLTERSEDDIFVYVSSDGRDMKDHGRSHSRRSSGSEDFLANSMAAANGPSEDSSGDDSFVNEEVSALQQEYRRLLCCNDDPADDALQSRELLNDIWRVCDVNKYYAVCPTYPFLLVVPRNLSDEHIIKVSRERSACRLPVLTWVHPTNGASLTRSSQPMVGINVTACPADEQLLMNIRESAVIFREKLKSAKSVTSSNQRELDILPVSQRIMLNQILCPELNDGAVPIDTDLSPVPIIGLCRNHSTEFPFIRESPLLQADSSQPRSSSADSPIGISQRNISIDEVVPLSGSGSPRVSSGSVISAPVNSTGDAAMTKIGGLMQGFRGTQSVMLRDKEYHRAKSQLHKRIDTKGLLTLQRRTKLRVIDCRPLLNAKGNVLMGKGHEVIDRLGGSKCTSVEFANIANIHGIRESYSLLRKACLAASQCGSNSSLSINWNLLLHESKWLNHLSSILYASACAAVNIQNGDPVLVHCSDGWDRTSQVAALAQLLLDPYYRTIEGFFTLVSKDFVWFGHRFRSRCGCEDVSEQAPIFLQFMDCVWQIWRQFPWEFEFNEKLLLVMLYAQNSRFTADFLYNSFKERVSFVYPCEKSDDRKTNAKKKAGCLSIFDHVKSELGVYKNPIYLENSLHDLINTAEKRLKQNSFHNEPSNNVTYADACSSNTGSTVLSEDGEEMIMDMGSPPNFYQRTLTSSVPDMISAAIRSDMVNERVSGSIVAKAPVSENLCIPQLSGIRINEPAVGIYEHDVVCADTMEAIRKEAGIKMKTVADIHTVTAGKALLSMGWTAEQQGGPVLKPYEDHASTGSMSTSSAAADLVSESETPSFSPKMQTRSVRLILPSTSLPSMALWEAVHMLPGIPFSSCIGGNSAALEKGLSEALSAEKDKASILEQQVRDMAVKLKMQDDRIKILEDDLYREKIQPVDDDTVIVDSKDLSVDFEKADERRFHVGRPASWGWGSLSQHPAVVATKHVIRTNSIN